MIFDAIREMKQNFKDKLCRNKVRKNENNVNLTLHPYIIQSFIWGIDLPTSNICIPCRKVIKISMDGSNLPEFRSIL